MLVVFYFFAFYSRLAFLSSTLSPLANSRPALFSKEPIRVLRLINKIY